jgi:hypothetical protein
VRRWRDVTDKDIRSVVSLWERCGLTRPWNNPVSDIAFARHNPNSAVLIWEIEGRMAASVMVGHDGHRGVMYYVGVDPDFRKQGLGREVVMEAEKWLSERGCWKINLLIRDDNEQALGFWERMGYGKNAVVSLGKALKR